MLGVLSMLLVLSASHARRAEHAFGVVKPIMLDVLSMLWA